MNRLASDLAVWVAVCVAIFTAIVVMFMGKSARREDYLKRVARKYSVPPLNLR